MLAIRIVIVIHFCLGLGLPTDADVKNDGYWYWRIMLPVLYMAIPGGILAFALYLYAQSKIEVSEANLFTYLNGVVAIPAAYFLLGETPSLLTVLAILLIGAGVYQAEEKS